MAAGAAAAAARRCRSGILSHGRAEEHLGERPTSKALLGIVPEISVWRGTLVSKSLIRDRVYSIVRRHDRYDRIMRPKTRRGGK